MIWYVTCICVPSLVLWDLYKYFDNVLVTYTSLPIKFCYLFSFQKSFKFIANSSLYRVEILNQLPLSILRFALDWASIGLMHANDNRFKFICELVLLYPEKKIVTKQLLRFHLIPVIIRKISKITEQILERTLRKGNPHSHLMRLQTDTVTPEISEISYGKNKQKICGMTWPSYPTPCHKAKGLSKPSVLWADSYYLQDHPHWDYLNSFLWSAVYIFVFFFVCM